MATNTSHYSLKKPATGEYWSTSDYNGNLDKIEGGIDKPYLVTGTPSKPSGSKWTSGTISLRKRGGVVQIKFDGAVLSAITERETIGVVPEAFVPATETYFYSADLTKTYLIDTGGNLKANAQSAGTVWATGTYIVG